MIQFVEKYFKYVLSAVGVLLLALGFLSWLREHDARILAEQTIKASESRVDSLQAQADSADRSAKTQIAALKKQAAAVQTPAQAIAEIPKLTDLPLNSRPVPELPSAVQVDALPLFQALTECKSTAVQLAACSTKLDLSQKIEAEKDTQITALRKPGGFWKRFGTTLKDVGIGVAIGYGVHAIGK